MSESILGVVTKQKKYIQVLKILIFWTIFWYLGIFRVWYFLKKTVLGYIPTYRSSWGEKKSPIATYPWTLHSFPDTSKKFLDNLHPRKEHFQVKQSQRWASPNKYIINIFYVSAGLKSIQTDTPQSPGFVSEHVHLLRPRGLPSVAWVPKPQMKEIFSRQIQDLGDLGCAVTISLHHRCDSSTIAWIIFVTHSLPNEGIQRLN